MKWKKKDENMLVSKNYTNVLVKWCKTTSSVLIILHASSRKNENIK